MNNDELTVTPDEVAALRLIQTKCYEQANRMGWHSNPREPGTLIALMHSELSEALEGVRKGGVDDHLPHRPMVEVELADCVIRILDFCGKSGYDLAGALAEKLAYNRVRADHQLENRQKVGGKAF